jgi:hypothetical protein
MPSPSVAADTGPEKAQWIVHGVSIAAELRRFGEAVSRAERIQPEQVPSRERRGRLYRKIAAGHRTLLTSAWRQADNPDVAQTVAILDRRVDMQLRWLGSDSKDGDSPTLYDTDEDQYVIQGFKITDPQTRAELDVPEGEEVIRVPKALMKYLPKGTHGVVDS